MDLPDDVMKHIQSFLFIVSWRAEYHFLKLFQRYKNFTREDIPSDCRYINCKYFGLREVGVYEYTTPLRIYLGKYRKHMIYNAWYLNSFTLFGIKINDTISSSTYQNLLYKRANDEGVYNYTWQGCIPLEDYKKKCTYVSLIY
jgi:hypothetical protein